MPSAPDEAMPCDVENLCLELVDGSRWGVLAEVAIGVYSFVGIAHVADAHLCTSLETLCARWQIPDVRAHPAHRALAPPRRAPAP